MRSPAAWMEDGRRTPDFGSVERPRVPAAHAHPSCAEQGRRTDRKSAPRRKNLRMEEQPVRAAKRARVLIRPLVPDAAGMEALLLFTLLVFVVARLAQGLKITFMPEQLFVAAMQIDVIADQERSISLDTIASSACIVIAWKDAQPQSGPASHLVPTLPWRATHRRPPAEAELIKLLSFT